MRKLFERFRPYVLNIMGEGEDVAIGAAIAIAVIAGIGAGIYLLGKFLTSPPGDVMVHRCPNCNLVIKEKTPQCPKCKQLIKWG